MNIAPRPWDNRSILRRPLRKILVLPFVTFLGFWFVTWNQGWKRDLHFGISIRVTNGRSWWSGFCWNVLRSNLLFKGVVLFLGLYFLRPLKIPWVGRWYFLLNWSFCRGHVDVCRGVKLVLRAFLKNMAKFSPHRFLLWKDRSLESPFGSGFLGGLTNHPFGSDRNAVSKCSMINLDIYFLVSFQFSRWMYAG